MKLIKKTSTANTNSNETTNVLNKNDNENALENKNGVVQQEKQFQVQTQVQTQKDFELLENPLTPTEQLKATETDPKLIELDQKLTADEFLTALGANFITADKIKVPEKDLTEFKPVVEVVDDVKNEVKENKVISIQRVDWDMAGKPIYSASLIINGKTIEQVSFYGRFAVGDDVYVVNNVTKDSVELIVNDKKAITLKLEEQEQMQNQQSEILSEVKETPTNENIDVISSSKNEDVVNIQTQEKFEEQDQTQEVQQIEKEVVSSSLNLNDKTDVNNQTEVQTPVEAQEQVEEVKSHNIEEEKNVKDSKVSKDSSEIKENEHLNNQKTEESVKETKSFTDFDKEKVNQYVAEIEKYDVEKQVKVFEDLQKRKKSLDTEIMQIEFQKQQIAKDIEKHQKEILELTGLDNVEDFAKYVLDTLRTNEEELSNFKQSIEEQEQKIKDFKLELAKL